MGTFLCTRSQALTTRRCVHVWEGVYELGTAKVLVAPPPHTHLAMSTVKMSITLPRGESACGENKVAHEFLLPSPGRYRPIGDLDKRASIRVQ